MSKISRELIEYRKKIGNRPLKLTTEVIAKMEEAAAIDATVAEICYYCDIGETTYYRWMIEYPDIKERLDQLREKPILKARQEVVKGLDNDKNFSFQYLKSKRGDEFLEGKTKVEIEDNTTTLDDPDKLAIKEKYEKEMRELLIKKAKENANKK
jgi:transposase-like protein